MYKGDAGGAELQDHEVATSGGIAGYHRGLRQTLGSLEAEHTRVVPKAQYLEQFDVYKARLRRSSHKAKNTRE